MTLGVESKGCGGWCGVVCEGKTCGVSVLCVGWAEVAGE